MSMDDDMQRDQLEGSVPDDLAAAVRLATLLGTRLRAVERGETRGRHVAAAAAAAAEVAARAVPPAPSRVVRRPGRSHMFSTSRPSNGRAPARRRAFATAGLTVAVAAVAVVGGLLLPSDELPSFSIGGSGGPMSAAPSASPMLEASDARADIMLWNPVNYVFELAEGARFGAGTGPAWRFEPPADLVGAAARLTAFFGLPAALPSEWDERSLQATGSDGASLWVGRGGDWYYSGPYDESAWWTCDPLIEPREGTLEGPDAPTSDGAASNDATADGADGADTPVETLPQTDCEPPAPPAGVPTADEARARAGVLLVELGLGDARIIDTWADEWGASVYGVIEVPGVQGRAGIPFSFGFGGEGRVTYASASLARAVRLGDYPTVDAQTAVERLSNQMSWSPRGGEVGILPMPAPYVGEGASAGEPAGEPVVETVVVTLVSVSIETSFVWTDDGTMLLVPHYVFTDADGGEWYVVAVSDRYITS